MRMPRFFVRWMVTGDPAATMDRLFTSRHVADLRLIVGVCLYGALLVFALGIPLAFLSQWVNNWPQIKDHINDWTWLRVLINAVANCLTIFAGVLAALGAVLAWAYQVGSARLGVVDLFACEISTLCRVATVLGSVERMTERFAQGPSGGPAGDAGTDAAAPRFTSQESYFPVFESGTRDLQSLEARVVINITSFYTYMKAVRDSARALAQARPLASEFESPPGIEAARGPWHEGVRNVVYMLFLSLESARNAIDDLVEFEPEVAERMIVILISELAAFRFLQEHFTDATDIRLQRIALRRADYVRLVPMLAARVRTAQDAPLADAAMDDLSPTQHRLLVRWEPAKLLLPELCKRYRTATGRADCEA